MKRGLSRREAAEYVGLSESQFVKLVTNRRMPAPKTVGRRTIYDRFELDEAFDELPANAEMGIEKWRESH